jgi:hypothetical protein
VEEAYAGAGDGGTARVPRPGDERVEHRWQQPPREDEPPWAWRWRGPKASSSVDVSPSLRGSGVHAAAGGASTTSGGLGGSFQVERIGSRARGEEKGENGGTHIWRGK